MKKNIAIVGSGLVGTVLAIYLKRLGHQITLIDRSPDIRTVEFSGRSINLVMSNRGWKTLEDIGIDAEIKKIGIPVDKRAIHIANNPIQYQPYGMNGESIFSISRGVLNKKMVDLAELDGVNFKFNHKIWDVTLQDATLHQGETERGEWTELPFDMVFGADGAFSRIRHRMQRQSMFNYSQYFLDIGYKELHIPADENGNYRLDKNSLHIWPRSEFMLMALANLDGSFTCTLFMPHQGDNSFETLKTQTDVEAFFAKNFPDTMDIMPDLVEDFLKNPTSALVTMKCFPWTYRDKVALIGDACHAIVPFYGHGMNAGFEDITILNEMIKKYGDDWEAVFKAYENSRKPNADAIAELSYRNFIEMSTKTADESFILQKKIEKWFSELHPDRWLPLYSRVTFSRQPYAEALAIGDKQNAIMQEVLQLENIKDNWQSEMVEKFILGKLG